MSTRIISTRSIEGRDLYASSGVQVLVHPIKIEHAVDLPDQMICRHHLVEIERVEKLTLSVLSPPHHRPLPRIAILIHGIMVQPQPQREFCNTIVRKRSI